MMRTIAVIAGAALLCACGGEEQPKKAESKPNALQSGEYQLSSSDLQIRSVDKTTPATGAGANGEQAATAFAARACIGSDGTIEPAAFAESGDSCTTENSYVRSGRINLQLTCTREGKGRVMQVVNGEFTADGFEAEVRTTTSFSGPGDYEMSRTVTGKRVGAQCQPASSASGAGNAAQ